MGAFETERLSQRLEPVIARWCDEVTQAQSRLNRQIADGREQLERLATLLDPTDSHERNRAALRAQVNALQAALEKSERRAADAERHVETLKAERAKLLENLDRAQSAPRPDTQSKYRNRARALQKELEHAQARLHASEEASKASGLQCSRLQQTLDNAETENAELRAVLQQAAEESAEAMRLIRQAREAKDALTASRNRGLLDELRMLIGGLQSMKDGHATVLQQWERDWIQLKSALDGVRDELRTAAEEVARLSRALDHSQAQARDLALDKEQLEHAIKQSKRNFDRVSGEKAEVEELLRQAQGHSAVFAAEKTRLEKAAAVAEEVLREERREKGFLIAERDALRMRIALQDQHFPDLQHARNELKADLEQTQAKAAQMALENAQLRQELEQAKRFATQAASKNEALRRQLNDTNRQQDAARKKVVALSQELLQARADHTKERDARTHAENEAAALKQQLTVREESLEALTGQMARWEKELERAGGQWMEQRGALTRGLERFRSHLLTDALFFLDPLTEELGNFQLRQKDIGAILEGLARGTGATARETREGQNAEQPSACVGFPENVHPLEFVHENNPYPNLNVAP